MKKFCVSVCLLFIGVFQLHEQRELLNPLVDSKVVREKGIALHEAGKYKAAVERGIKKLLMQDYKYHHW